MSDSTQQNNLHSIEENVSSFADDTATPCDFNIIDQHSDTETANDTNTFYMLKQPGSHSQQKHTYRNTFGKSNIQYHDFDNQDSLTFADKYTALLQQELQNPYWNLHDPIMTKSYQISKDMDIEMMQHAMNGQVPISSLRLNTSVNCSTFARNSSLPFSSNTESLRLSFIRSISLSVIFLLMSPGSNQGYLSSEVDLFVLSTGNSVHVVMHGISVEWIGFSYANGDGLNMTGVILSWKY